LANATAAGAILMCDQCTIARVQPDYRLYNPACLWCGARIIQCATAWHQPAQTVAERRRHSLALWVAHGHSEEKIRALVKGSLAIEPVSPVPAAKDRSVKPQRNKPGAKPQQQQHG